MKSRSLLLECDMVGAGGGVAIDQARLTDQQRVAVVLQGAALLSQLEHGGWIAASGWREARLTDDGLLRVPSIQRGRSDELVQLALARLLRRAFRTEGQVAGRGEARSAARYLLERWQQILAPSSADQAVTDVLTTAPFLWRDNFTRARRALVAEHSADGRSHLWLAGPGAARTRFLAGGRGLEEVQALLAGSRARDLWDGWRPGADPAALAERRRWRQAAVAWSRDPPRGRRQKLSYARSLFALGRYSQTLQVLSGQSDLDARLLKARSQYLLGRLTAARNNVRRLSTAALSAEQLVELAELAIRLLAARGQSGEIQHWVARALEETRGRTRLRAQILAAAAAWDCDDLEAMDRYLEDSRGALDHEELAGRWHHVRGLRSMHVKDGPGAVSHVGTALKLDRRQLLRAEAGRLWNDLAVSRVHADDLPGAERAARHAQRLLQDTDGPSRTTLALYNLAEVRLRRGRSRGVESILERSTAENRRSENLRGLVGDLELWIRLELARGRSAAALARCTEALLQVDRGGPRDRRGVLETFAARAYGWLGRRQEAAECLARAGNESVHELEPEERPAVWALAGQGDQAAAEASGTRWEPLWQALAAGEHPPSEIWLELDSLEPFRAARLIFDGELLLPGVTPPRRLRMAVAALRRSGADAMAEKLESRSLSPWRALETYMTRRPDDGTALEQLFAGAGYDDLRLVWNRDGREDVLLASGGGEEDLSLKVEAGGYLVLRAPFIDDVLRTLMTLIARDLTAVEGPDVSNRLSPASDDGIVGESAALKKALKRLERLAENDLPLLILGESGTGKELTARRAHRMSHRGEGPFLPINCAAVQESLVQSDLFGHVKGSFTGADRDRPGIFESARSGTVFLDEIGDLPPDAQGKLLRVLQEGEIRRIGESFARSVDVRVITATHRNLEEMANRGEFRRDLFFRLKVATVSLPPLRERGKDLLLLVHHFLTLRRSTNRLSGKAKARLLAHEWPGNVRELRNVLEVADTLAHHRTIRVEHLDLPQTAQEPAGDYHQLVEQYRRGLISKAMSQTGGNRAAAARRLGMSRQALSYLVRQLGLS